MNAIQIIELILQLAPGAITLTMDALKLIQSLEAGFAAGNVPQVHQHAIVGALALTLKKAA